MKNESDVKDAVKKCLKSFGESVWYFMPVMSGFGQQGIPDFIACVGGRLLAIETKFGGNKMSEWQKIQMNRIRGASGMHVVIDEKNIDDLEPLVREMLGEYRG